MPFTTCQSFRRITVKKQTGELQASYSDGIAYAPKSRAALMGRFKWVYGERWVWEKRPIEPGNSDSRVV